MDRTKFQIRLATVDDTSIIFDLIKALAEYEKLSHQVTGDLDSLREHLFGESPCIEAILAETTDQVVGFALFFANYSTFLTKPGIHLEDLFVLPDYRRQGIATAMLRYLGELARTRNSGRLEWSVLDWNQDAINFYQKMGAEVLPDRRICRVAEARFTDLASND